MEAQRAGLAAIAQQVLHQPKADVAGIAAKLLLRGQTNFVKSLFKLNSVYRTDLLLADPARPGRRSARGDGPGDFLADQPPVKGMAEAAPDAALPYGGYWDGVHVRRGAPDVQDPKLNSHSKLNCITACICMSANLNFNCRMHVQVVN